ncbi:MAG: hypothetical protein ACYDCS_12305 [Candidatus Dormibacteria bacterium]
MSSFFRRRRPEPPASPPEPESEPEATGIQCSVPGCSNDNALSCEYRDRRGHLCAVSFCSDHGSVIQGVPYCRRHASTVRAIGPLATDPNGRPDLDDRIPSLVNWISRELDGHIRAQLEAAARVGESVVTDDAVHLSRDQNRNLRWERSWRLVESTGLVLKISIHVSEENDALVRINVGSEMVADGIPPWIARRRMGEDVDVAIDVAQRQLFYRYLQESIAKAVAEFRGGDRRYAR